MQMAALPANGAQGSGPPLPIWLLPFAFSPFTLIHRSALTDTDFFRISEGSD